MSGLKNAPLDSGEWELGTSCECPRARRLIDEVDKPIPGPLIDDPFAKIAMHLLIDLASEVAKCHVTVACAQIIYEKIHRRYQVSLLRYGGTAGNPSWIADEQNKIHIISNFVQGTSTFLSYMSKAESQQFQSRNHFPWPCE